MTAYVLIIFTLVSKFILLGIGYRISDGPMVDLSGQGSRDMSEPSVNHALIKSTIGPSPIL